MAATAPRIRLGGAVYAVDASPPWNARTELPFGCMLRDTAMPDTMPLRNRQWYVP